MREREPARVQEHPLQALPSPACCSTRSRRTCRRRRAESPGASGARGSGACGPVLQFGVEQRERRLAAGHTLHAPEHGLRVLAVVLDAHAAFALARRVLVHGQPDDCASRRASGRARARDSACRPRRRATRHAARPAPRASSRPAARPRCRGRAGARVRGIAPAGRAARNCSITPCAMPLPPWTATPGRLVERDQVVVLVQDGQLAPAWAAAGATRGVAGNAVRTGGMRSRSPAAKRVSGSDALAVHAHFSRTHDPVHVALRDALEDASEEIVDPLPGGVVAHRAVDSRHRCLTCSFAYNCPVSHAWAPPAPPRCRRQAGSDAGRPRRLARRRPRSEWPPGCRSPVGIRPRCPKKERY